MLKTERIYRCKPTSFRRARTLMDREAAFYNSERIQLKPGAPKQVWRRSFFRLLVHLALMMA